MTSTLVISKQIHYFKPPSLVYFVSNPRKLKQSPANNERMTFLSQCTKNKCSSVTQKGLRTQYFLKTIIKTSSHQSQVSVFCVLTIVLFDYHVPPVEPNPSIQYSQFSRICWRNDLMKGQQKSSLKCPEQMYGKADQLKALIKFLAKQSQQIQDLCHGLFLLHIQKNV